MACAVSTRTRSPDPHPILNPERGRSSRAAQRLLTGTILIGNEVSPGNTITLTAPYAVASGDGLLIGSIFGIAAEAAALGETVEAALVGVFNITKVGSQAWTVGARVYWDETNKRCTTVATDNTLVGVAVEAVASGAGDTIGRVRLNSAF